MPTTIVHALVRSATASADLARPVLSVVGGYAYFGYWFSRMRA